MPSFFSKTKLIYSKYKVFIFIGVSFLLHALVMLAAFGLSSLSFTHEDLKPSILTFFPFQGDANNKNQIASYKKKKLNINKHEISDPTNQDLNFETKKSDPHDTQNADENQEQGDSVIGSGVIGRLPENPKEIYLAHMWDKISRNQFYPMASKTFNEQGQVVVQMILDQKGNILEVKVTQPSPYIRLNEAAVKSVQRAAPFGDFPSEVKYSQWKITLPMKFILNN